MRVRRDQSRDDGLAGHVDACGAVGQLQVGGRDDRLNPSAADQQRGPFERRTARAVDQARAQENDDAAGVGAGLRQQRRCKHQRPAARRQRERAVQHQSRPGTPLTQAVGPSSHLLCVNRTTVRSARRMACSSPYG